MDPKPIIDFINARTTPQQVTITAPGVEPFPAFVGSNGALSSVEPLVREQRQRPRRRSGTVKTTSVGSFVELVNRDKLPESVIFADDGHEPRLVAVLNYHGAPVGGGEPAHCDDRITYSFPLSEEWQTWTKSSKRVMSQQDFAEFIEANGFDIGAPDDAGGITAAWAQRGGVRLAGPSEMMGVSKGLSVRVEESVQAHTRLESGEIRMEWTTEHKGHDGTAIKVPAAFHVLIPILHGGPLYSVPARLRYRATSGKVTWFYELHKPDAFLRDAVGDVVARLRRSVEEPEGGCGLLVVMGFPPGVGGNGG